MIPAAFDYVRAGSADEAIRLIGEHGDDAKFLAGGHSLLPLMKLRLAQPIGARRHRPPQRPVVHPRRRRPHRHRRADPPHGLETSRVLAEHVPLLAHAAGHVGDPQVRHRGTIGGSIAHSDPASDLPATMLALGATFVAQGPERHRARSPPTTSSRASSRSRSAADELLTEIRVPKMQGAGWNFQKFNRRAQDWAIVGVAAGARNGDSGVGLVNMGSTPILATSVSNGLPGRVDRRRRRAGRRGAEPPADLNASPEYRAAPGQGARAPGPRSLLNPLRRLPC